ncbi:MAG: hypothetical protein NTZ16_07000 [Verrucomicrobia bacterium]|nr:hypothetical protein [Verrucomicrobiota bacterium]
MSAEQENFEALRKLLALKKHEQPPPGYFDQFASEVRSRLAAGEHRQTNLWRELGDEASWLQRLWAAFADKPALAGAFGMAVCALMLSGIYLSQKPEPVADAVVAEAWQLPAPAASQILMASSTNPVPAVPVGGSLFDRVGIPLQTAPVNFQPQGQ